MTKSEIAFQDLGIVTRSKRTSEQYYQYAEFDSLAEFAQKMKRGYDSKVFKSGCDFEFGFTNQENDESWRFGKEFPTWQATYDAMQYGAVSQNALDAVERLRNTMMNKDEIKDLVHQAKTLKKKRVFSECGSELDIDRVLCGDPEHWMRLTPGKKTSVVKIGVNMAVNGGSRPDEITKICAFGLITCELLSHAGFSTEFSAIYCGTHHTHDVDRGGAVICVKQAHERMDIQKISCAAIPGIFRSFVFGVITDVLDGRHREGLGQAAGLDETLKGMLNMDFIIDSRCEEKDIVIEIGKLLNFNNYEKQQS